MFPSQLPGNKLESILIIPYWGWYQGSLSLMEQCVRDNELYYTQTMQYTAYHGESKRERQRERDRERALNLPPTIFSFGKINKRYRERDIHLSRERLWFVLYTHSGPYFM